MMVWPGATPMDAEVAVLLAVRAPWAHMAKNLQNCAGLDMCIRRTVQKLEGLQDEVVVDCLRRHLERCATANNLLVTEITHLLTVLIGHKHAVLLMRSVLDFLEAGAEETWYDKQLRKRYGGERLRQAEAISDTPRSTARQRNVQLATHSDMENPASDKLRTHARADTERTQGLR
ncbi:hypothetical protein AB1Y20_014537 [Prymnesium parvum]|uniref:Spindle pole body component n=1 Tax=Prymnesium parvum TaxID=97485 RepID=A0AB34IDK2_PRYPA